MSESALVSNLQDQLNAYQVLVGILEQEIALQATCSLSEIGNLQEQRDRQAQILSQLEKERIDLFRKLFPSSTTLQEILPFVDQTIGKQLTTLKAKLRSVVEKVKSISKEISERAILRRSCFLEARDFLQQNDKQRVYYSSQAKLRVASQSVLYDKKA